MRLELEQDGQEELLLEEAAVDFKEEKLVFRLEDETFSQEKPINKSYNTKTMSVLFQEVS